MYKEGVDPLTGTRYLEELAFEVVSKQNEREVWEKASRMHRRGVRRIFAIFVKRQQVSEWSPESQSFRPLAAGSWIEDACLVVPLRVKALLDAATASDSVIEALAAQDNPALRRREAAARSEGKAEGEAKGKAEGITAALLRVLQTRGIAVSPAQRQEILRCVDLDRLDRWLGRAALASSASDALQG